MTDETKPVEHVVELRVRYPDKKQETIDWKKILIEKAAAILLTLTGAWAGAYFVAEQTAQTKVAGINERLENSEVEALVFTRADELYLAKVREALKKASEAAPITSELVQCQHCQGADPACEHCRGASYARDVPKNPVPLPVDVLKDIQSQVQEQLTKEAIGPKAEDDPEEAIERTKRVADKLTKWTKVRGGPRAIELRAQQQVLDQNQERKLWLDQAREDARSWDWDDQIQEQAER